MMRVLRLLAFAASIMGAAWGAQDEGEYQVGVSYPTISSTHDIQPKIQRLPDDVSPKLVPLHKLPRIPEGSASQTGYFGEEHPADIGKPAPRKYAPLDGLSSSDSPWSPPDPNIAIGPNHIVETVNMNIAWWRRSDGALELSIPLNDSGTPGFFEDVGSRGSTFDPRCFYDDEAGRFFVLVLELYDNESYITFAVSDDDDPNGLWYKYRTDAKTRIGSTDFLVDYPGVGYDSQAYYCAANLFDFSLGFLGGAKFRVFPKSQVLNGNPLTFFDLRDSGTVSPQCAQTHGDSDRPYFVSASGGASLSIKTIENPISNPSLQSFSLSVSSYRGPPPAPLPGGRTLDTLDGRLTSADYRDGRLYATHAIAGSQGQAVVRWYEVEPGQWPSSGVPILSQEGNVAMDPEDYLFFPAIARGNQGDVAIVMAQCAIDQWPAVRYVRRESSDPAGEMPKNFLLKESVTNYDSFRWGDYFDIATDPNQPEVFWGVGEYAKTPFGWGTWIDDLGERPAEVIRIEPGCPGWGGVIPSLNATDPVLGSDLTIRVTQGVGGAPYLLLASAFPGSLVFRGCPVHVGFPWAGLGPFILSGLPLPGQGSDSRTYPLPEDARLLGISVYAQAFILDAQAPNQVSTSNGIQIIFGDAVR